ncbi:MAG: DUF1080 domain-containing protein [Verrucomicrobiaceae bacterium]|nr:DUF1080 domain-containing protein [Verrucomicrobiaceae bacterium]
MKKTVLLFPMLLAACALAADPVKKDAPKAEEPAAPKEFVLFDGKSLDDWEMVDIGASGAVEIEGGLMIINAGDSISGAVYKKAATLPVTNYEISLEAKRLDGVDFFCGLTFPVNSAKTCATLVCGGWGGAVTGISSIDNLDASENNTSSFQKFEDDKWYTIRVRVTPEKLGVWIGEKHLIDEEIKGKKISVRPGPIESYLPLSLTTFATTGAYRNIKLKVIEPEKH